jgi:hypothetical protein
MTDPVAHGLSYIGDKYGSPAKANDEWPEHGWYKTGGAIFAATGLTIREPEPTLIVINDQHGHPILTVHPDGRVTLDQPDKADEAAHVFADTVTQILTGRITVT